jgi:hypothetical protein
MKLKADIIAIERQHRKQVNALKDELTKRIQSLPQNPILKPLAKNAFIISFSNLGKKWGPEAHDFRIQYEALVNLIERAQSPLSALMQIRKALLAKRIVTGTGSRNAINPPIPLHPLVIGNVRKALAA